MGKIQGAALLGFVEEFDGHDEPVMLGIKKGATLIPPGSAPRKKPPGKSTKPSPHNKVVLNTANAGKAAIDAAKRAQARIAAKPPVKPPTKTAVGAARTPKQQAAINLQKKAAAKSATATARVNQIARKAGAAGAAAVKTANGLATYFKSKFRKGVNGKTKVGTCLGYIQARGGIESLTDEEVLGLADFVGEDLPYDPYAEYNMDPNAQLPPDPSLSMTGVVTGPDGTVYYDPATDPSIVPMPVRDQKMDKDTAATPWNSVPDDGIVYDGSAGWDDHSKGSWNFFYGPQGKNDAGVNDGQIGMIWTTDSKHWHAFAANPGPRWIRRYGKSSMSDADIAHAIFNPFAAFVALTKGNDNWDDGFPDDKSAAARSGTDATGPLIGNPNSKFAGLQYAVAEDKWFWQGDYCPKWAAAEADHKITVANKQTIAANTAAAQLQVAQMVKDAADAAAQQAAQDAANALAESAAVSQANVADIQAQSQQAMMESQAQQLMLQQAQADMQQQTAERQAEMQQRQAEMQLQAAERQQQLEAGRLLMQQAQSMPPGSMGPGYPAAYSSGGYNGSGSGYGGDEQNYDAQPDNGSGQGFVEGEEDPFAGMDFE